MTTKGTTTSAMMIHGITRAAYLGPLWGLTASDEQDTAFAPRRQTRRRALDGAKAAKAEVAQLERPVAKRAAGLLAQIARQGPPDVAAARAFAGREIRVRIGPERAALATGQALDKARGHRLHRSARTGALETPD